MTNVELVERLLACVGSNDVETAVTLCDPAIEFVDVLAPMEDTVRNVRGAEGLRDWFDGLHRDGKRVTAEPVELHDLPGDRVLGTVRMVQDHRAGDSFALIVHVIWALRDGRVAKIDSFFDSDLALTAAGGGDAPPMRRWVEGVVTAKVIGRQTVRLRSAEHEGREFSVRDPDVWHDIRVGAMGIAETDAGELVGWRPLT